MRTLIVCAVLALLTTPTLGNNKPRYEPTGTGEHSEVLLEAHCWPERSSWLAAHRYRA